MAVRVTLAGGQSCVAPQVAELGTRESKQRSFLDVPRTRRHSHFADIELHVMKFNPAGRLLQLWTIPKGEDGQEKPGVVNWRHAMAVDSKGDIYVGDIIGKRAQKFVRQK